MKWQVRDFKGIENATVDIRRGKATILTGVNSSGKSSVIQSFLLAAQSLNSEGPMVLNGPLVRLGDARDLVREASEANSIELTMDLDLSRGDDALHHGDVTVEFDLVPTSDSSSLHPRRLTVSATDDPDCPLELVHANSRASDIALVLDMTRTWNAPHALRIKRMLGSEKRQLRTYVVMQGLRPVAVMQVLDPAEIAARYRKAIELLLSERHEPRATKAGVATAGRASNATLIREFVRLFRDGARGEEGATRDLANRFDNARTGNPYAFDQVWETLSEEERGSLVDVAVRVRQRHPFVFLPVRGRMWGYSSNANGLLEVALELALGDTYTALSLLSTNLDTLADRVQYLGPLRDEPRVVWNHWNELARGLPVGTRGEYSAAVLSRSKSEVVQYTKPSGERASAGLGDAVNSWLAHLEIGDTVAARSHGKLGVGLDLRLADHVRDLTSVGVGVSQTLPLLVGVLAAPRDALFIVEQPELHLHPAVQARLADFFLMARPDLAFIIETHSDSFITRVRRRVAEGRVRVDDVDITFVEPTGEGSIARTLEITEFGDLSEWPDGFLASAEEDIRAILQANIDRSKGAPNAS